jgi:hypothetical protein
MLKDGRLEPALLHRHAYLHEHVHVHGETEDH